MGYRVFSFSMAAAYADPPDSVVSAWSSRRRHEAHCGDALDLAVSGAVELFAEHVGIELLVGVGRFRGMAERRGAVVEDVASANDRRTGVDEELAAHGQALERFTHDADRQRFSVGSAAVAVASSGG